MRDIRNILACRPLSGPEGPIERFASDLARAHGARVHVTDLPAPDEAGAELGPVARVDGPGHRAQPGPLARLLRDCSRSVPIDLVVIQRPGAGDGAGPLVSGTEAHDVVRGAGVPVLSLPEPGSGPSSTEAVSTVLVPADLTDPGDPALEVGRRLASRIEAGLVLLDVTGLGTWLGGLEDLRGLEPVPVPAEEVERLGDVRSISERARVRLRERLVRGMRNGGAGGNGTGRPVPGGRQAEPRDGVDLLLSFVRQVDGCLTVVSGDGLQSLRRPLGPCVADTLVDRAPCPVLMVESSRTAAPVRVALRKSA